VARQKKTTDLSKREKGTKERTQNFIKRPQINVMGSSGFFEKNQKIREKSRDKVRGAATVWVARRKGDEVVQAAWVVTKKQWAD